MADQITKSVRRIVKNARDEPAGLGDADDYKGIGTSRGEAFINARGDVTGSGSEGSGDDIDEQPTSDTPDDGTPDDNDTGGGGGVNSGSDPSDALTGDVDAVVPAIDVDAQVGTVTGTDPATGGAVDFNPNTLEGIEYTPPTDWWSPTSEDGLADVWDGAEITTLNMCSILPCPTPNDKGVRGSTLWDSNTGFTWTIGYFQIGGGEDVIPGGFTSQGACVGCDPDSDFEFFPSVAKSDESTLDPPEVSSGDWPSDGSCQVVFDREAGGYKGNVKDPDCSAAQKTASDSIIIRSVDDSSKYYKFTRLADGGTKITVVDSAGTIVPNSVIRTIDEGGRYSGFFPDSLDASIK